LYGKRKLYETDRFRCAEGGICPGQGSLGISYGYVADGLQNEYQQAFAFFIAGCMGADTGEGARGIHLSVFNLRRDVLAAV
jgi:hypothetical protein